MLDIKNLKVRYKGTKAYAVDGVSFSLDKGSFTGLVGESGSGKSTIVSASLGLLPRDAEITGEAVFNGQDILKISNNELRKLRWKEMALIPQSALNSFTPVLTIGRHITETLEFHFGLKESEARQKAALLLKESGLSEIMLDKYPHEMSGGEKQRAAIALSLACSPSLLFADEPTTALDVITQAGILKLLSSLKKERNITVLLITHDMPMAASVCDRLIVMRNGLIMEDGTPQTIINNPKHEYTKALVRAIL